MIPVRDSIPSRTRPYVNYTLIALNIFLFIFQISLGPRINAFITMYGIIPAQFLQTEGLSFTRIVPLFSSMFLHGGLLHLGANMLFLFIFGDNVEDSMGHFRYLFFYLLVGILATLAHIYTNPLSAIPSIGASGAISGILGAYILMYPKAKIYTLIFLLFFITVIEIPAFVFIGLWFIIQIASGLPAIMNQAQQTGGVAYFAHIGGFVAGLILILFFRKMRLEEAADVI